MIEIGIKQLKVVIKPMKPPCIWFQTSENEALNDFKSLEDKLLDGYTLSLKKTKKRSLNANNYMWQLCDKIAYKAKLTKEDVYRHAVREVGAWFDITVKTREVESLDKSWLSNGVGWFTEPIFKGEINTMLRLYKGSSVYDSVEMNRLIDYIVDEAKGLDIETLTPNELLKLKELWKWSEG